MKLMKKAANALDGASDAARTANKAGDLAKGAKGAAKADNVGDAAKGAAKADNVGDASQATRSGKSQIDRKEFRRDREAFWREEARKSSGDYTPENLRRMQDGKPPIGSDGFPMELHHVEGTPTGGLKPMTRTDHRLGNNYQQNHPWLK
jgi:hypothetical protein